MPLARTFDAARRKVVSSAHDGFIDRLSRWSDIREYMQFLYDTARSYDRVSVLELGARRGNSTLAFLAAADETGGHVWSCDVDDVRRFADGIGPFGNLPRWTFICGDDMDPAVQSLLPAQPDVLFIDTSHTYGHTLAECRAYVPRVAPGGVALFHDTRVFGDWSEPGDTVPPVRRALDDFCAEAGLAWEELPGEYGMGVIRL